MSLASLTPLALQVDVLRQQLADEQLRRKVSYVDGPQMCTDWGSMLLRSALCVVLRSLAWE